MLLLSISFALSSWLNAQGNLQFNRVLSQSVTSPASPTSWQLSTSVVVVPAGKVWKVENASFSRLESSIPEYRAYLWGGTSTSVTTFYLDDFLMCNYYGPGGQVVTPNFPIWLNEGSHTLRLVGTTSANYGQQRGTINIIEFNIIP